MQKNAKNPGSGGVRRCALLLEVTERGVVLGHAARELHAVPVHGKHNAKIAQTGNQLIWAASRMRKLSKNEQMY